MKHFKKNNIPTAFYTLPATPLKGSRIDRRGGRQRRIAVMQWLAFLLLAFCLVLLSARAFAASDLPAGNDPDTPAVAVLQAPAGEDAAGKLPQTRIETDHETGEIRFIINGETVAILSGNGITVHGNINGHAFLHSPSTAARETDSDQADNQDEGGAP